MDETEYLLSSAENAKRLKASIKELKGNSKDDFFGIWADKSQDIDDYVGNMRHVVSKKSMIMGVGNNKV